MTAIDAGADSATLPEWLRRLFAWMAGLVTNAGLANNTAAWHAYTSRPLYVGWGTGSGQGVSDTDLATASNEARAAGTSAVATTSVANDTYQVTATLTSASDSHAITEVAIFDAAGSGTPPSGGNMDIYADFAAITIDTDDAIAFTIKAIGGNT